MSKKRKGKRPQVKSKYMYTFDVKRSIDSEQKVESQNEDGEKVVTTKTVSEVISEKVAIKRPSRRQYDDAELFYGVKLSEGIKAGLLTKALLAKRYEDDGGSMSEREKEEYFQIYYALLDKENEYQRVQLNLDNLDPEEKESKLVESLYDILELRKNLRDIEEAQASLFNQTAENRARNQVLMWWVLQLGYMNGQAIFPGDSFDEKADIYDEIESKEEPFWDEIIKKLAYFISFWYSGQATDKEDFDRAMDIYKESDSSMGEDTEDMESLEDVEEEEREIRDLQEEQDAADKAAESVLEEAVEEELSKDPPTVVKGAVEEETVEEETVEEEVVKKEVVEEKPADKEPLKKSTKKRKPRKGKPKADNKPNENKEEG
jgi:hypothetical protein